MSRALEELGYQVGAPMHGGVEEMRFIFRLNLHVKVCQGIA